MKRSTPLLLLIASLAAACDRPSRQNGIADELKAKSSEQIAAFAYQTGPQGASAADKASSATLLASPAAPPTPRAAASLKLIWTATLQVEVPDFQAAVDQAGKAAISMGGYVSDRQSSDEGAAQKRGQLTLRIPSDRFEGALGALKGLGRVTHEGVQTQDVTKAYADLETRLAVKRETAGRLREILKRQTGKVSEVLEVEREIARVVEEIEQAEGERRFFDNQVSLSTISLSLYEPRALVSPGALDSVLSALRRSLRIMGESLASLIELGAALLPWLLALYLLFRAVRWRLRRRN